METLLDHLTNVGGGNPHQEDKVSEEAPCPYAEDIAVETENGPHVVLHVYDLDEDIAKWNKVGGMVGSGLYHAGIELWGVEFCYGATEGPRTGIYSHAPKQNPVHQYVASHDLGPLTCTRKECYKMVNELQLQWCGSEYHLFRRNCISFVHEVARRLGVRNKVPMYISQLMTTAKVAADGYIGASQIVAESLKNVNRVGREIHKLVPGVFSLLGARGPSSEEYDDESSGNSLGGTIKPKKDVPVSDFMKQAPSTRYASGKPFLSSSEEDDR